MPDNVYLNPQVYGGDKTDVIVNDTTDKSIFREQKTQWSFKADGVIFDNQFPGSKLSQIKRINKNHYEILSLMENSPINDSPWFSFVIRSQQKQTVKITLIYPKEGTHRYHPKISTDTKSWTRVRNYKHDKKNNRATFTIETSPKKTWISAQEIINSQDSINWSKNMASKNKYLNYSILKKLKSGRVIPMLYHQSTNLNTTQNTVIIMGRQHPPEVTGSLALRAFVQQVFADSALSKTFLKKFNVYVFPIMNPDGVDLGHWRHNINGVDLNRDWLNPNQEEIKALQELFISKTKLTIDFFIDFHSTTKNIFYLTDTGDLKDNQLALQVIGKHAKKHPSEKFEVARISSQVYRGSSFPWFYNNFKAAGMGYETKDDIDRSKLKDSTASLAITFMEELLAEKR